MTTRENLLKCIRFQNPQWIPMTFVINPACWHHYDQEALKDLMESHPLLFPGYIRPKGPVKPNYLLNARVAEPYTDPWGCVWETADDGITGAVHVHPLANWDRFADYKAPNPELTDGTYPIDWKSVAEKSRKARAAGEIIWAALPHGHTWLRLQDIRGYEDLILDMSAGDTRVDRLVEMISRFNYECVLRLLATEPDVIDYADDLGMQMGPMISPELFRKYIKPVYRRIMEPARKKGCIVAMHSDGDIRALADDLVDAGVEVLNLQDLVNGLDWIKEKYAGRVCIHLDIDRQSATRFGTKAQIDALIREEVEKLGSAKGGLMMIHGMYPGVPLENAKALMDAMEKYATYWA